MADTIREKAIEAWSSINSTKEEMRTVLAKAGEAIDASTLFEKYPELMQNVADRVTPAENVAVIVVTINPTGGTGKVPTDETTLAELITDAYVSATADGLEGQTATISKLDNEYVAIQMTTTAEVLTKIQLHLGTTTSGDKYLAAPVAVTAVPGKVQFATLQTYKETTDKYCFARVQPLNQTNGTSYLEYLEYVDGAWVSHFGRQLSDGSWLNETGHKSSAWSCADADSDPVETCIVGSADEIDIDTKINALKPDLVEITLGADTPIKNVFARFAQLWVKRAVEERDFIKQAADGTETTSTVQCVVIYFANEQLDASFHLLASHQDFTRDQTTGAVSVRDLTYAYVPRYAGKRVTVQLNGVDVSVLTSASDASVSIGTTRAAFLGYCKNNNQFTTTTEDGTVLEAGANSHRYTMAGWLHEVGLIQYLCYLKYGVDIQAAIKGLCTSTGTTATANGDTDFLIEKGILWGSADITDNTKACVIAGIENGIHSSEGWMVPDLTFYARRLEDDSVDYAMQIALDPDDYDPGTNDYEGKLEAGYHRLDGQFGGNTRLGTQTGVPYQDMMIFGTTDTVANITTGGCDAIWRGSAPSSGTVGDNAYMVALGASRANGSSLGLWVTGANYALSYSGGYYWRGRVSYRPDAQ